MSVILVTADLMVVSRVQDAVRRAGSATVVVSSETAAMECDAAQARAVVIDLGSQLRDLRAIVEHFKASVLPPRIIAFGPHVHEERLAAARDAGCDEVVSRGQFFAQMDSILQQ
jgi:DNA-binding NarL/FixJ family response regulator